MLSYKTVFLALLLSSPSLALPIRREVPQEHSHQQFLTTVQASLVLNNPDNIQDAVFGLLGNAAAAGGAGKITDATCLQQATADQAFTNAKAAGDVNGQVAALIYRALERNSGTVGGVTAPCTSIKAVNPEIAAIQQHQDPASANAAAVNKAITLELAKQIAAVGGDPQDALKAGTFAPGNTNDNTGKGNTCDDANDAVGCIFTQNLLVEDATAEEIDAAVKGVAAATTDAAAAATSTAAADDTGACVGTVTVTVAADATATTAVAATTAAEAAATTAAVAASSGNIGNFGSCSIPEISFGVGFDGRKETSFEPTNKNDYNHGSAQAITIITQFMCDTLVNKCGADATAKATCASAQTAANAVGKIGLAADTFNAKFGISTNFKNVQAVDDQGRVIAGSTGGNVAVAVPSSAQPASGNNLAATPASSSGIGNFGSCSVPEISFGVGFDGRKETSFEPTNKNDYNHGSAQAITIITQFMCDTLVNKCGADATAKATCASAQTAANAVGKIGLAADTFNAKFGISTNFKNVQAVDDQGRVVAGSTGGNAAVVTAPAATSPAAANEAAATPAASGANLQKFTGALGGKTAPPVTAGGSKGFVVDGSEFINLNGALGRSCDVQHNACANAANTGGGFSVSDCDAQNTQCHAAI